MNHIKKCHTLKNLNTQPAKWYVKKYGNTIHYERYLSQTHNPKECHINIINKQKKNTQKKHQHQFKYLIKQNINITTLSQTL